MHIFFLGIKPNLDVFVFDHHARNRFILQRTVYFFGTNTFLMDPKISVRERKKDAMSSTSLGALGYPDNKTRNIHFCFFITHYFSIYFPPSKEII